MLLEIRGEIGKAQKMWQIGAFPPQLRPYPRQQHLEGERLDDVIIGSSVEPTHLIGWSVFSREEQNGQALLGGAESLEHTQTIKARHHDIQNDQVGSLLADELDALLAILSGDDGETFQRETTAEHTGDRLIIVDHDN